MEDTRVSPQMICINLVLPKIREIHRFCTNQYWVNINIYLITPRLFKEEGGQKRSCSHHCSNREIFYGPV